jgi:hypothetical protein
MRLRGRQREAMRTRGRLVPMGRISAARIESEGLSPRSFIIGLPADAKWSPQSVANTLRKIQLDLGPPTHVHGLYVIGVGCFFTVPVEPPTPQTYRIRGWSGQDRMFRFATFFRGAFDSWLGRPSADLYPYLPGEPNVTAE